MFENMLKDVAIVIPTKGRVNNQLTVEKFTKVRDHFNIICHHEDYDGLCSLYGDTVKSIKAYPPEVNNIGLIRDWAIETFDEKYILFMDDNVWVHTRSKSEFAQETVYPLKGLIKKHFSQETIEKEQIDIITWLVKVVKEDGYAMSGLSPRAGNNRTEKMFLENSRLYAVYCLNKEILINEDIKFSTLSLKEDFFVALSLLSKGYKNIASYQWAFDKPNANMKGGCSTYRTLTLHNESAYQLKELFPDFVTIREKSVKSWGGEIGNNDKALDVFVQWKKAYESSQKSETEKAFENLF